MSRFIAIFTMLLIKMSPVLATTIINFQTENHDYGRYNDQMESMVNYSEEQFDEYLGNELECRTVRLSFNIIESVRLFKKGIYNIGLSAVCNKNFTDFNMDVEYGYSNGEPMAYNLSFVLDGVTYKQRLSLED